MSFQNQSRIIFAVLLLFIILSIQMLTLVSHAQVQPMDPRIPYVTFIAAYNSGSLNWVGSWTQVTLSASILVPTPYSSVELSYDQTLLIRSQASISAVSAIGVARNPYSYTIYGIGGGGEYKIYSYDGFFCDHTVVVENMNIDLEIEQIGNYVHATYYYVFSGYYWKHGWACWDDEIDFTLVATSEAYIYGFLS